MRLAALFLLLLDCAIAVQPSLSPGQNPLQRSLSLLPNSADWKGQEADSGKLRFLLLSSYSANTTGTGKVWVVPSTQPSQAFVLITGLDAPTGICYDRTSRFLYVVDAGLNSASQGRILQFTIDTDLKDRFILAEDEVATIYEGPRPFDCWVDAYGNLYFVDSQTQSINIVSFLDLWSGFANKQVTLYRRTSANPQVSVPVSLQVVSSSTIYYVNNANTGPAGLLNSAPTRTRYLNEAETTQEVTDFGQAWGLAVTEEGLYYSTAEGEVWRESRGRLGLKAQGFGRPRGVCASGKRLYVADNEYGEVLSLSTGQGEEVPEGFIRIPGVYEVYCLNN